jgi:hypothetical protein
MVGVLFQVRHDVTPVHPERNEAESGRKQFSACSYEREDIWVLKLSPNKNLCTKFLKTPLALVLINDQPRKSYFV